MLALVLDSRPTLVENHPAPRRSAGEARLRMRVAGVCDTDVQLARGYMHYRGVLGHEFVAEVLEAESPRWTGRRVVADINASCGNCADCLERDGHHCLTRTVLGILGRDGAFAEELVIPERNLVEVPESVPDDAAVFAEPLAAAAHVLDLGAVQSADRAIVVGDGKLGLLTALTLAGTGHDVTLVGHHSTKLAIAGASGVTTLLEQDCRDLAPAPVVVEATGSDAGLAFALGLTAPRGTLVLKTTVAGKTSIDLAPVVINEISVVGSRCGDLRRAIDLLAEGRIDPTPLIAARYSLAAASEALEHASRRGTLKVLVENGPSR